MTTPGQRTRRGIVGLSQGIQVHRIPASGIYHDLGGAADAVLVHAEALIAGERRRAGLAPSTTPSTGRGPPPAASRGR
jgi:hypothetical protein